MLLVYGKQKICNCPLLELGEALAAESKFCKLYMCPSASLQGSLQQKTAEQREGPFTHQQHAVLTRFQHRRQSTFVTSLVKPNNHNNFNVRQCTVHLTARKAGFAL